MTPRLPHRIIGCTTEISGLVHCVNCPSEPFDGEECETVRLALDATVTYNGRLRDVPLPLTEDQKARIKALRAASTAEEMYKLAGVADLTCDVRQDGERQ